MKISNSLSIVPLKLNTYYFLLKLRILLCNLKEICFAVFKVVLLRTENRVDKDTVFFSLFLLLF